MKCFYSVIPPCTTKGSILYSERCPLARGWCHQDSNRGHTDFQSDALPTELWHLMAFAGAKVMLSFLMPKFFATFFYFSIFQFFNF